VNSSKEYAEWQENCKLKLPHSLAMNVCEWSASGSGLFISDVPFTEVLRSLHVTAGVIKNYWKKAQNYNIRKEKIRGEKLHDRFKNTTKLYYIILRPTN
jgi:hypothetical protein